MNLFYFLSGKNSLESAHTGLNDNKIKIESMLNAEKHACLQWYFHSDYWII